MKKTSFRWLLAVALVVIMAAALALTACNNLVTATFEGGVGADGTAPEAQVVSKGEEITLPNNTFTKSGHHFVGWSDGEKVYQPGAKYALNADVTFTAQWEVDTPDPDPIKHTLSFDVGAHAAANAVAPESKQLAEGEHYNLPAAPAAAENWEFDGWGTDKRPVGYNFVMGNADVKLVAQWKEKQVEVKVPFVDGPFTGFVVDLQLGMIIFDEYELQDHPGYYSMELVQDLSNMEDPSGLMSCYYTLEDGEIAIYVYQGGSMQKIGDGAIDEHELSLSINIGAPQNLEVSAQMYKLTISGMGESDVVVYYNVGAPIYVLSINVPGTITSAVFNEVALDIAEEAAAVEAGEGYTEMPARDSTLALTISTGGGVKPEPEVLTLEDFYGIWVRESGVEAYSRKYIIFADGKFDVNSNVNDLEPTGYYEIDISVVDGVMTGVASYYTIKFVSKSQVTVTYGGDTTVYKRLVTHNVQFDLGECEEGTPPSTQQVVDGEKATEPQNVTWSGHRLTGWIAEGESQPFDFNTPIIKDIKLVAQWVEADPPSLYKGVYIYEDDTAFLGFEISLDPLSVTYYFATRTGGVVQSAAATGVLQTTSSSSKPSGEYVGSYNQYTYYYLYFGNWHAGLWVANDGSVCYLCDYMSDKILSLAFNTTDSLDDLTVPVFPEKPSIEQWYGYWNWKTGDDISYKYLVFGVEDKFDYSSSFSGLSSSPYLKLVLSKSGDTIIGTYSSYTITFDPSNLDEIEVTYSGSTATYKKLVIHTVTFVLDEGQEGTAYKTQQVPSGETITAPTKPTRDGFRFLGWYLEGDSTNNLFAFANTQITEDITLVASWQALDPSLSIEQWYGLWKWQSGDSMSNFTYVQFHANGQFGYGPDFTSLNGPYDFILYQENDQLKGEYKNVTVVFESATQISVIVTSSSTGTASTGTYVRSDLELDDGSFSIAEWDGYWVFETSENLGSSWKYLKIFAATKQYVTRQYPSTLGSASPDSTLTLYKEGGVLKGRYGSYYVYEFAFEENKISITYNGETTEYTRFYIYTVTFDLGGSPEGTAPDAQQVVSGEYASRPYATPTWSGHRFLGWFAPDASDAFAFTSTPITADITLTAHWETITEWIVTFDANASGATVTNMPANKRLPVEQPLSKPTETPERAGYRFKFWSTSEYSWSATEFQFDQVLTSDITLYAIWEQLYTITFKVDGSTNVVEAKTVASGGSITLPELNSEHWKPGYTFLGWAREGYDSYTAAGQSITSIYNNYTYVAVFGKIYADSNDSGKQLIVREGEEIVEGSVVGSYYKSATKEGDVIMWEDGYIKRAAELNDAELKFTLLDEMRAYSFTSRDDATLTFDGKGMATLDSHQLAYTVTVEDGKLDKLTLTIDSNVKELQLVYNNGEYVLDAVIVVQGTEYIFGQPKVKVTIVYEAQDGESNAPENQIVYVDYKGEEEIIQLVAEPSITKHLSVFDGWKLKTGGSDEGVFSFTVSNLALDTEYVFVAVWAQGKIVTVTFEAEGSTEGTVPQAIELTIRIDGSASIVLPMGEDLKKGNEILLGWKVSGAADDTAVVPGSTVEISEDVTYVAVWGERLLFDDFAGERSSAPVSYGGESASDGTITIGSKEIYKVDIYWDSYGELVLKYYPGASYDYEWVKVNGSYIRMGDEIQTAQVTISGAVATISFAMNAQGKRMITITCNGASVTWTEIEA